MNFENRTSDTGPIFRTRSSTESWDRDLYIIYLNISDLKIRNSGKIRKSLMPGFSNSYQASVAFRHKNSHQVSIKFKINNELALTRDNDDPFSGRSAGIYDSDALGADGRFHISCTPSTRYFPDKRKHYSKLGMTGNKSKHK